MPSAIIHNSVTATQIKVPLRPAINLTGLDTASMEIDFPGSIENLLTAYAGDGSKTAPAHSSMYCVGVGDIISEAFGWIHCTIRYKGFWYGPPPTVEGFESGTSELVYPFENGGAVFYYGKAPGKTADTNPANGGKYWRVRDINDTAFITRRGVEIGAPGTIPAPPGKPGVVRPAWMDTGRVRSLTDPLIATRFGWVRRRYSITSEETLGTGTAAKVFRYWEDQHEWVDLETP